MEELVKELTYAGIAVDLLVPAPRDDQGQYGVRLRTYGRDLPPKRMVLGAGHTFEEAMYDATEHARASRWELLDWSARPWDVDKQSQPSAAAAWGFV